MKVVLDEKEYELPPLSISKYNDIQNNNLKDGMNSVEFISFMTGIPIEEVKKATIPQITFVSKAINNWYSNTTKRQPLKQLVNYKGQMLGLTLPSQMTWGEFSDLEILASQKTLNFKHLAAILYRPCENYNVETLERKVIKYDYDECLERVEDMGDFPIGDILSACFFFMTYAKGLMDKQSYYMAQKKMEFYQMMKEQKKKS